MSAPNLSKSLQFKSSVWNFPLYLYIARRLARTLWEKRNNLSSSLLYETVELRELYSEPCPAFAELFTCFPAARLLVSRCGDPEAAWSCVERPRPRPNRRPAQTGAKPTLENSFVDSSHIMFPNDWRWKKYDLDNG